MTMLIKDFKALSPVKQVGSPGKYLRKENASRFREELQKYRKTI